MRRGAVMIEAMAILTLAASLASAQPCRGRPESHRGWVGGRVGRVSGEPMIGGEVGVRAGSRLNLVAAGDVVQLRDGATPNRARLGLEAAAGFQGFRVPLCATAAASLTTLGDLRVLSIPVGIAAGWAQPVAEGFQILSYVEPRMEYRGALLKGFYRVTTPFSMVVGSGVAHGRWYGGLVVEWTSAERRRWLVGVRAAVGF